MIASAATPIHSQLRGLPERFDPVTAFMAESRASREILPPKPRRDLPPCLAAVTWAASRSSSASIRLSSSRAPGVSSRKLWTASTSSLESLPSI